MPSEIPNRLLASLTPQCRRDLMPLLREVDLPIDTSLYEAGQEITQAYFLNSGFASQVIRVGDTGGVEVGVVSWDGMVGSTFLLGRALGPGRCFMQAAGTGYAAPFGVLQQVFASNEEVRSRILEFAQQQMLVGSYLSACNKLHEAEPRLARWLLMVQDRLKTDLLPLTQEFLAQMLGSRRMTVTTVAGTLQSIGLIEYRRGQVRILNREGLEDTACECYRHTKKLLDELYRV